MADLESVISSSIEGLSGGDTGDTGADPVLDSTAPADGDSGGSALPETDATPAAAAPLSGDQPKRRGPIPWQRHDEILAKARTDRQAEFDALQQRLNGLSWAEQQDVRNKLDALNIADSDPARFLEAVLSDPRFSALAEAKYKTAAPQPAAARAEPADRPKPDVRHDDGSLGYSPEQFDRLQDWNTKQAEDRAYERATKELEKKYGPVHDEWVAKREWDKQVEQAKPVLEHYRATLPGFRENEVDIRNYMAQALNAKRPVTPEYAYTQVMLPKLKADRDTMRNEILEEIKAKPEAAVSRPGRIQAPATSSTTPRDLTDVIADSISRLGQ